MAAERRAPTLRTLLLAVNGFVLLVPLGAIALLELYDAHLVEATERRLIGESAVIAEAWRDRWLAAQGLTGDAAPDPSPPGTGELHPVTSITWRDAVFGPDAIHEALEMSYL